jgi:hypothetical protein
MPRKTVSIKGKRAEATAAAQAKKKKKTSSSTTKTKTKAKTKRKSRKKVAPEVRLKAFWGVFNQSLKRVALYEYSQRRQADKKAEELQEKQNTPHFVQLVKEVIQEE